MIEAPTACFFTAKAMGEGAQAIMSEISPAAAIDIVELTLISTDFSSDIAALNSLADNVKHVGDLMPDDLSIEEKFNPLYIPCAMEEVDQVLDIHLRNDSLRFTGFSGNPYTVKLIDMRKDDAPLVTFSAQFHPFELPLYNDIVEAHEHFRPN